MDADMIGPLLSKSKKDQQNSGERPGDKRMMRAGRKHVAEKLAGRQATPNNCSLKQLEQYQ
jgi:hypothetical protein